MLLSKVNRGITHSLAMYQKVQGKLIVQLRGTLLGRILERESGLTEHHFTGTAEALRKQGVDLVRTRQGVETNKDTRLSTSTVKTHGGVTRSVAVVVNQTPH